MLIFGYGFTGRALVRRLGPEWTVAATSRDPETRGRMRSHGLQALDPSDTQALAAEIAEADALLIAAPPGEDGCPGLEALGPWLAALVRPSRRGLAPASQDDEGGAPHNPRHAEEPAGRLEARTPHAPPVIAYLSTTGVYGDHRGGWVREDTPPSPLSPEGERRLAAEQGWRALAETIAAPLFVFRLPGIYGPGRSPLDRVREGAARRWVKPGQVFSRIHVDDLADAVARALERPHRAGVYNLCDDEPAAPADVTAYACRLLGLDPPPEEPLDEAALSPMARRFWAESKRVSNAKAKAALGWRPAYATSREGLRRLQAVD